MGLVVLGGAGNVGLGGGTGLGAGKNCGAGVVAVDVAVDSPPGPVGGGADCVADCRGCQTGFA